MSKETNSKPFSQRRYASIPNAISSEMQLVMEQFPSLSLDTVKSDVPANIEAWRDRIHAVNSRQKKKVKAMRKQFNVSVELLSIVGVTVRKITPEIINERFQNKVYIDLHGGAYVFFSGFVSIEEGILIADRLGIVVYSVDYRMPPSSPFPAALNDACAVYDELRNEYGSNRIFIGGTSAGGGLTLALLQQLKQQDKPLPVGVYLGTPWADLSNTSDSLLINEEADRVLVSYEGSLSAAAQLYAGSHSLTHPGVSPLYGNFDGLPPTILVSGTRDLFLSDTVRVNRKLREHAITTQLEVFEGMSHAMYLIGHNTPESLAVYAEIKQFFLKI
ncbi:esterase [Alteromonas sp. RW2A1]|uniref:alpha/beta hydrolase fold domain-containing protein n=1 Tax=Alteromonas sp. RW2A1 TaxID=1917158 RepID=UPI000903DF7A|nr:alpha/beta hydrolase fold domain-containing protein [Alteromonas sp. RW2A1]APE07176.1 esterase [Alteromonas sp. RW2A1]